MADDIATTMDAAISRSMDAVRDNIAVDGVTALKRVLDGAGFPQSDHLKDYEVFAHVNGDTVSFEILLSVEAFDMDDAATKAALEEAELKAEADEAEAEADEAFGTRTYGMQPDNVRPGRLVGMRDVRSSAKSAFTSSGDRKEAHEAVRLAPRAMRVDRRGKLSLRMTRSVEPDGDGFRMPKGQFQGVMGEFVEGLRSAVLDNFAPEFERILARQAG